MALLQDFYNMFMSLPEPKRLIGFSKFATVHYATEGRTMCNAAGSADKNLSLKSI